MSYGKWKVKQNEFGDWVAERRQLTLTFMTWRWAYDSALQLANAEYDEQP